MVRTKNPSYRPIPRQPVATREESSDSETAEDSDLQTTAMLPESMFFSPADYKKTIKLSTRCYITKAVALLDSILDPDERRWFEEHPQFKHFFHMPRDSNHKLMGMWMLVLRMARTDKKKDCWFIVNGVPVRYSIREHGLISGLYCHAYPRNYERLGSLNFVSTHFSVGSKITYELVEEKLKAMGQCGQRLNMAVLYFLASVLIGKRKTGNGAPSVEPFFLRAASDLKLCRTFPWGRLTFDANMAELFHWVDHFESKGSMQSAWTFPSFVTPLELLPFEAVLVLMSTFREDVVGASNECPRMCKRKFKSSMMKGFPISEINETLGTTRDIHSILEPSFDEEVLMARIMDNEEDEEDRIDAVVDSWNKILLVENRSIWFRELYDQDVEARTVEREIPAEAIGEMPNPSMENVGDTNVNSQNVHPPNMAEEIKRLAETVAGLAEGFKVLSEKFEAMDSRVKSVEEYVKVCRGEFQDDMVFQSHDQEDVQVEEAREKEGDKEGEEGEKEGEDVEKEGEDVEKEGEEVGKEAEEVEKEKERREEVEKEGEDVEKEAEEVEKEKERREEVEKEGEDVEKEVEEVEKEKERREEVEKEGEDVEKEAEEVEKEKERGEKKDKDGEKKKFLTIYERRAKGKKTPSTMTKEGGRKVKRVPKKRGRAEMSGYRAPSTRNTRRSGN